MNGLESMKIQLNEIWNDSLKNYSKHENLLKILEILLKSLEIEEINGNYR